MAEFTLVIEKFNQDRTIQAIKAIRQTTGLGLKEAKGVTDHIRATGQPRHIVISGDFSTERAIALLQEHGVIARIPDFGEEDGDDDTPPLPIAALALKLAMLGLTIEQVVSLGKALNGIEDATGSLKGAAKLMKEVA